MGDRKQTRGCGGGNGTNFSNKEIVIHQQCKYIYETKVGCNLPARIHQKPYGMITRIKYPRGFGDTWWLWKDKHGWGKGRRRWRCDDWRKQHLLKPFVNETLNLCWEFWRWRAIVSSNRCRMQWSAYANLEWYVYNKFSDWSILLIRRGNPICNIKTSFILRCHQLKLFLQLNMSISYFILKPLVDIVHQNCIYLNIYFLNCWTAMIFYHCIDLVSMCIWAKADLNSESG